MTAVTQWWVILAAALPPFLAALAAFITSLSHGKTLAAQSKTIDQTHTLVNSKFTEAVDRIASLEAKLGLQPGETIPTAAITTAATKKAKP